MRVLALLLGAVVLTAPAQPVLAAGATPAASPSTEPAPPQEAQPKGVLTRAPELVEFVPAEYPPEAAAKGIEGAVELSIVIDEHGEVVQAVVLDPGPDPGFAPAALHAVTRFRFRPAEIDGQPAAVEITYRYQFVLKKVAPPKPPEAPVVLTGRVIERGTRDPVAGAAIEAAGASAETDADGRFELRGIAPGEVTVRIVSPAHDPLTTHEKIVEGKRREVEYRISRKSYDPYESVVRAERSREVSVHTLESEEVRTVPGTQGDVLKVIQDLPGVARSPFGIGLLVVRGSEPSETNVYLDGILVPILYHFAGITSVVSSDVIRSLDFFPGNFGVRYGRALGGTVDVHTKDARDAFHGAAQVDVYDGRIEVEGPVGEGTGFLSLRRSWVDAVLALALPRISPTAANELRVAPRYWDYQGKLTQPWLGGTVSLLAYGSDDKLEFVSNNEATNRPTFYLATSFHRLGATWRRPVGSAMNALTVALGRDDLDVLQSTNFGVRTGIWSLTLRDAATWRLSDRLSLEAGVDAIFRRVDYSIYAQPIPSPGTIGGFDTRPEGTVGETATTGWLAPAAYVQADWRVLDRLRLVPGLRVDYDSRLGGSNAWIDPRIAAYFDAAPGTTVTAAAGLFGSAPQPQDTTRTFGNPDLGVQRALHLALGVQQALPYASSIEATVFYKKLWDLVVPTRATDPAGDLLHLSNGGHGEVVGLELLLRRELARGLFGWISYTLSRSIRQDDPTSPTYPAWHLFVLDQTHILALVLSYRLPGEWIVGTRLRAVSGNPYTQSTGNVYDADSGRFQCIPSATTLGGRLPGFFQADARVDKRFVFDRWMFDLYVDVQNATNRTNAEARIPGYDCVSSFPLPARPVFPALGGRAGW